MEILKLHMWALKFCKIAITIVELDNGFSLA